MFLCNNATCGYFYHPKCVARKLHPNNKIEALEKENKIIGGSSFTCPIHWCFHCKGLEDRSQEQLQFAVCRRCPKSYHRKCLPRCFCLSLFKFLNPYGLFCSSHTRDISEKYPLKIAMRTLLHEPGTFQKEF